MTTIYQSYESNPTETLAGQEAVDSNSVHQAETVDSSSYYAYYLHYYLQIYGYYHSNAQVIPEDIVDPQFPPPGFVETDQYYQYYYPQSLDTTANSVSYNTGPDNNIAQQPQEQQLPASTRSLGGKRGALPTGMLRKTSRWDSVSDSKQDSAKSVPPIDVNNYTTWPKNMTDYADRALSSVEIRNKARMQNLLHAKFCYYQSQSMLEGIDWSSEHFPEVSPSSCNVQSYDYGVKKVYGNHRSSANTGNKFSSTASSGRGALALNESFRSATSMKYPKGPYDPSLDSEKQGNGLENFHSRKKASGQHRRHRTPSNKSSSEEKKRPRHTLYSRSHSRRRSSNSRSSSKNSNMDCSSSTHSRSSRRSYDRYHEQWPRKLRNRPRRHRRTPDSDKRSPGHTIELQTVAHGAKSNRVSRRAGQKANKNRMALHVETKNAQLENRARRFQAHLNVSTENGLSVKGIVNIAARKRGKKQKRALTLNAGLSNHIFPSHIHFLNEQQLVPSFSECLAELKRDVGDGSDDNDDPLRQWAHCNIVGTCEQLEKRYLRLTEAPDSSLVRPRHVLLRAMDLVQSKWRALQTECIESMKHTDATDNHCVEAVSQRLLLLEPTGYRSLNEQMKSIRQDLIVQCICDDFAMSVYRCNIYMALEANDREEFNQCQSKLKQLQESHRCMTQQEFGEFVAYRILYYIYIEDSLSINPALQYISVEESENKCLSFALEVRKACALNDYRRFFVLLARAPKHCAYLMRWFIARMRITAVKTILTAYRPSITHQFLLEELQFTDYAELVLFMQESLSVSLPPHDVGDKIDCRQLQATLKL